MMPGNPNERRIYIRFKEAAYVEEIELAAHANGQTRQEWSKSTLIKAARRTKEEEHLEKTLQKSQLITFKVLEKSFLKKPKKQRS